MGRVSKFKDVKTLESKIEGYFKDADSKEEQYTISGLALHLGFNGYSGLLACEQTPKFGASIKKAKFRIEKSWESRLIAGKPPIGLIFALKNRFGWQDKKDLDITSGGETLGVIALPQRTS